MSSLGTVALKVFRALNAVFCRLSKRPPWNLLDPPREVVVMSLTPPNSAALLISLTRISAIAPNDGNSSLIGALLLGLTLLMPSMETESMLGFAPPTERLPLESVCTPACVVSVEIGLVEPLPRDPIATGRSTSSRPVFATAMLETSVVTTVSADAFTITLEVCAATVVRASIRTVSRAARSAVKRFRWKPGASTSTS
jgi:hypothetical protein